MIVRLPDAGENGNVGYGTPDKLVSAELGPRLDKVLRQHPDTLDITLSDAYDGPTQG